MKRLLKWLLRLFRRNKQHNYNAWVSIQKDLDVLTILRQVKVKTANGIIDGDVITLTAGRKHCWVKTKYGIIRKPLISIIH